MGNRGRIWRPAGVLVVTAFILVTSVAFWLIQTPAPGPAELDPNPVRQGGQLRVSARGFFPLEPLTIQVSGKQGRSASLDLGTVQATIHGDLEAEYVALPDNLNSGAHRLTLTGTISGRQSKVTLYVRAKSPWVTLATTESKPRAELGLVAGGFEPGERVRVTLGRANSTGSGPTSGPSKASDTALVGNVASDRVGNTLWSPVKLPMLTPGSYLLTVEGQSSGLRARTALNITAYQPSVELSPWAGPPGSKVQLNARGFEAGEKVAVFLGNNPRAAVTVIADRYGNLWGAGPVRVPYQAGVAPLTINLVGTDSTARTSAQFRVLNPKPWLELTQYWGAPGGSVEFSGGGWAAGERIAFHLESAKSPVVAYGRADDYGWLHNAGPATIPKDATYQVAFVAMGENSHSVATATFKIVLPFGISPVGVTPTAGG